MNNPTQSVGGSGWLRLCLVEAVILFLATSVRVLFLDWRPAHFDEGVNGWFVDQITHNGFFAYDPANYHGPLHFYVLFCSQTLLGRNLWALRLPVALVGIATVYLVLKLRPVIGQTAARLSAVFLAVSPAFVFYHRYSIHETWLVFFLILFVLGAAGMFRENTRSWLWCVVAAVTGMALTKETYVIHLTAFLLAWPCLRFLERFSPSTQITHIPERSWTRRDLMLACGTGVLAYLFFYSGNFLNWQGVPDSFRTFGKWFTTGVESGDHSKPIWYWMTLFLRYEWVAVVGLAGCVRCLWPAPRMVRLLAIYGSGTFLAYSLIPYKTPWCIIALLWPFLILAGWWISELIHARLRWLTIGCTVLLIGSALFEAVRISTVSSTDDEEAYVYVQTYKDLDKLTKPLLTAASKDPTVFHAQGVFWLESYYPLPWLLGDFTKIGYFKNRPEDMNADFILIDEESAASVEESLTGAYYTESLRVRSAQKPAKAYFSQRLFKDYFEDRTPELFSAPSN